MSVLVFSSSGVLILESTLLSAVLEGSLGKLLPPGHQCVPGLRGSPLSKILGESRAWFPSFEGGTVSSSAHDHWRTSIVDKLPSAEVQEWTPFVPIPLGDLVELWQARTLAWSAVPRWSCYCEGVSHGFGEPPRLPSVGRPGW